MKEQNCHKKLPICGTNISNIEHLFGLEPNVGAENCTSILVETGVYSGANDHNMTLNHSPRDFLPMIDESLQRPSMIMPHVLKAVEAILEKEEFSLKNEDWIQKNRIVGQYLIKKAHFG